MVGEGMVGKEIAHPHRHDGGIGRRWVAQGCFHAGHMAAGLDRADQRPGELAGEGQLRLGQAERFATIRDRISHVSDSTSVLTELVNILDVTQ